MQSEIPGSLWIPNNNCFVGRGGYVPKWIILHGTAGGTSARAIANYFKSTEGTANPVSAHIIIDQAGTIVQCNAIGDGAYANGYLSTGHDPWWDPQVDPNNLTIAIEHVKASQDNSDELTDAQKASSFAVVAYLCDRWGIPKRAADTDGGVTGHYSIDPLNRSRCPGAYPWDELWAFLKGEVMVPYRPGQGDFDQWFVANPDGTWTCKSTKAVLLGGNLTLYQSLSIDGLTLPVIGLPLESEQYHKDPDGYSWSTQKCERAQIVYDPEHHKDSPPGSGMSYLAHILYEDTLFARITELKAKIASAQKALT